MLRIAARYADQWDTFAAMPGTATDGVEADIADRIAMLDRTCAEIGRDPREIRRSTWTTADALESTETYLEFVRRYRALGFTDFTTVLPRPKNAGVLRAVAEDVIPAIRTGQIPI